MNFACLVHWMFQQKSNEENTTKEVVDQVVQNPTTGNRRFGD